MKNCAIGNIKRWYALAALAAAGSTAYSQYAINWYAVAGGGGTSTNGSYAVSGTIGQHSAGGPMTNGQYAVSGGFWVMPTAVQTEGAPTLSIAAGAPGQAVISWSPGTPGYVLQESPSLSPAVWVNSPSGSTNPVTVPAGTAAKFYRLQKF